MSDIVNAFKQKSNKKRANYLSDNNADITSELRQIQQRRQENTVQQDSTPTKALESAQQQNISYNTGTSESEKLAQLQQAAAAEQAQNEANAAAAAQQQQQQTSNTQNQTTTTTTQAKDNEGWKKYYDEEKQKVRDSSYKSDGFGSWLQDVFNSGWDSRLAESNARNRYASELLSQAYDNEGNTANQEAADTAKTFTAYNSGVAKNYSDYEKAKGNAIGANLETQNQNPLKSTANAIRSMDVGNAIFGSDDPEGTEGAKDNTGKDIGKFLANLLPGLANAPTTGFTNLSEAISGTGLNKETGLEEELDTLSRVGRGISGAVDVAGTMFGGSKNLIQSAANALFNKGATEVAKQAVKNTTKQTIKDFTKAMLEEGTEEAVQQAAEFFGDGGKLVTSDGQFDQDSFNDLLKQTGEAAALGAVGGGIFHAGSLGIDKAVKNIKSKSNVGTNLEESANIPNNIISQRSAQAKLNDAEKIAAEPITQTNVTEAENINQNVANENTTNNESVVNNTTTGKEAGDEAYAAANVFDKNNPNLAKIVNSDATAAEKATALSEYLDTAAENGQISQEEHNEYKNQLNDAIKQTAQNDMASQAQANNTSTTGQPINPQTLPNVNEETAGTQASSTANTSQNYVAKNTGITENGSTSNQNLQPEDVLNFVANETNVRSTSDESANIDEQLKAGLITPAEANMLHNRLEQSNTEPMFTDSNGNQSSVRSYLEGNGEFAMLPDERKNDAVNVISIYGKRHGGLDQDIVDGVFNSIMGAKQFMDFRVKRNKQLFDSEENQQLIKSLGIEDLVKPTRRYGKNTGGAYVTSNVNPGKIEINLKAYNSLDSMKSAEVHEAAHAAWNRLSQTQKYTVGKNLLEKIGINLNPDASMLASIEMNELIAYSTEYRWENNNSIEGFGSNKVASRHLNNILKYAGQSGNINLRDRIIRNIASFATYIKGKVAGIINVKTYDDFYNGLINGDFAESFKRIPGEDLDETAAQRADNYVLRGVYNPDFKPAGFDENGEQQNAVDEQQNAPTLEDIQNQLNEMAQEYDERLQQEPATSMNRPELSTDVDALYTIYKAQSRAYARALESGNAQEIANAKAAYDDSVKNLANTSLSHYNVNNGVVINPAIGETMLNDGYDRAGATADQLFNASEGNAPIAHDYTTGEDIYDYNDLMDALKRDNYQDAAGNTFESFDTMQAAREKANQEAYNAALNESIARTEQNQAGAENAQPAEEQTAPVEEPTQQPTQQPETTRTMTGEELQNRWNQLMQEYDALMDENLSRKIQDISNVNADVNNPVDLVNNLTTDELERYQKTLEKLHEAGVVENVEEAMARGYLPQQYAGSQNVDTLLDEFSQFDALGKWWNNGRTGAVAESGNMDYSNAPIVSWHIRGENPDLVKKASAENYLQELNPDASQEQLSDAADDMAAAIDELNTNANRGTGGDAESGAKKGDKENPGSLNDSDINKMNLVDKLEKAGEKMGIQKNIINDTPRGLSDDVRLKNLNQWDDNACFGYIQNVNAYANETAENVDKLITDKFRFLTKDQLNKIISNRNKLQSFYEGRFGNSVLAEYMTNRRMIKNAFTQNSLNYMMQTKFTNKQTHKLMDDYFKRYMLQDRMEQSAGQKIGSAVQRIMNSSFRGLRLQTTLNEIPEIVTSLNDFKTMHITVKPSEIRQVKAKYGFTDGLMTKQDQGTLENVLQKLPKEEQAQAREELENARSINQQMTTLQKIGQKLGKAADNFDTVTQWNAFIQDIKDATYLANAEKYYSEQGMSGAELTNAVLSAYEKRMLPQSRVYKILKADRSWQKPLTLYLDSNARLTRKFAQGAVGLNNVGVNAEMGKAQRIARNTYGDLLPRAVSAMVMGVPFAAVAGMFQLGGDYSGIDDEDKTVEDQIINFAGQFSPLLSVATYWYNQGRQEQINDEDNYNPVDLRGDANERGLHNAIKTFTPVGNWLDQMFGTFGNQNSTAAVLDRGYGVNKSGRTTYMNESGTPAGLIDAITALIGGANMTSGAREYNNNPNLLSAILNEAKGNDYDGDGTTEGGFSDFLKYNNALQNPLTGERPLVDEDDYNRPASQSTSHNYNEKIQEAMEKGNTEEANEWYKKSREYNSVLDTLRVNNKDAYDVYEESFDKNLVSPEKYARIAYGNESSESHSAESIDLTVWNTMKSLALKQKEDFGGDIDPAYTDLDDEQTREYLQYKSAATGDDILLKKKMCVDEFWDSFFDKQSDYYSQNSSEFDDSQYTQRVQQWNDYNDQYSDYMKFISGKSDTMKDQNLALELSLQFPLMREYQSLKSALQKQYGDDYKSSTEYKAFWSQNYDAYQAESEAFNTQMLYIINQMRGIEGYDEMTLDQLEAINNFGKDSSSSSGSSGSSGYSSYDYSYAPSFENIFSAAPVYAKNYHTSKSVTPNLAGNANFESIDFSSSAGYDPYNAV